jgi:diguanylate cyclase (GGDEF)-like protein
MENPWPKQARIHAFSGEFKDAGLEQQYQQVVLSETARQQCLALTVVGALFLLFVLADIGMMGPDAANLKLLVTLRLVVAGVLFLLAATTWQMPLVAGRPLAINSVLFLFINASITVLPLRPETIDFQVISLVATSIALYLFIPTRLLWAVLLNAWLATGFVLVMALLMDRNATQVGMTALVALLPNVVGYLSARRLNRLQREQFLALQEARHSNLLLQQEITERQRLEVGLRELAQTDDLTGLSNRRSFLELAGQALRQARRASAPLTICMIDIDHFKPINDNYGHAAGDVVLAVVAAICRDQLRDSDIIGRYGGEEFVVALPNTDAYAGRIIAERLRARIENHRLSGDLSTLRLTVTAGIAQVARNEDNLEPALLRADEALYEGKREGRNRVALAS